MHILQYAYDLMFKYPGNPRRAQGISFDGSVWSPIMISSDSAYSIAIIFEGLDIYPAFDQKNHLAATLTACMTPQDREACLHNSLCLE